ncbi:hypothetical protein AVEN_199150-1 [Araneus ventricosus]|uniref:Uncharacterized protein n=1 Tax=Araneus ventricosus TaxID=182803 RepID=A0A4Y2JZU5_ARAVE|nr:hypothetical protein AVEN_199150-1 [Araneus ventricosus]
MKTAKNQNNIRKSLKTSTPISENVVSNFLPSLKPMNMIKPNHRKKKSVNSYYEFLSVKKRSKAKGFNIPCSYHQGSTDIESCKENPITPSSFVSKSITKSASRSSKTSALKPLNTFKKCDKISDISPIYPEWRCGKRYRYSHQNSDFDLNKGVISLNKSKNQNSRNSGDANLFSRMPLASCSRASSPFISARNDHEVKGVNLKEDNVSINADVIFKNSYAARNKRSTLNEITLGEVPRRANSSIVKKVRFSDRVDLFGGIPLPYNNLNSGNTPVKNDKTGLDPYGTKELLEFLEDKRTLVNEKEARISTSDPQLMKRTNINGVSRIKESEKCIKKKIIKDGGVSKRDETSKVKRTKLKNSSGNFKNEKDSTNKKRRKNLPSKNNNRAQRIVDERLDWDINISAPLKIGSNSKLSSTTGNEVMNTELDEEEAHLTNEKVLYLNILNGAQGSQKNDTVCTEDFVNNNKYEEREVDIENNLLISQTKGPVIGKNGESKQKEGETVSKGLELLDETILYPPTSTPFDSPQRETKGLSLNFQCLSPILEHQPEIVSDAFYDYEASVVCAERTYGKCKLKSISKEEKLWSLITTTGSIDTVTETFSATTNAEGPKEQEENAQDILLFETPPLKILSGESFECKRRRKEGDEKIQKKSRFHKKTKHAAGKRTERKSENKTRIRKMENSSELSTQQSQLSKHFEDVLGWNLCIERKEPKMKFFAKENE